MRSLFWIPIILAVTGCSPTGLGGAGGGGTGGGVAVGGGTGGNTGGGDGGTAGGTGGSGGAAGGGSGGAAGGGAAGGGAAGGGSGGAAGGGSGGGAAGGTGGSGGAGGGTSTDAGQPIATPLNTWSWVPVEGSECASGTTAGLGVNLSAQKDDLFIFVMGGGACWNQGTCVPNLLQFGPICFYNPNVCLFTGQGGQQPLAANVLGDPYPRDGGGVFPGELAQISQSAIFRRSDPNNPFRDATYVFVPYCTGDLHSGATTRSYQVQTTAFGPITSQKVHFSGATNFDRYLERLAATVPNVKRIWLTGVSAGGYGATLNFERVSKKFPNAEVHLLADCSPFLRTNLHWTQWRDTWAMQLPENCPTCDAGFPEVMDHLATKYANRRLALLATEADQVITYFFYGGTGPDPFLNPPYPAYAAEMTPLLATAYDPHPNAKYFVVPGNEHVIIAGYGVLQPDGGVTAARLSRDGGTNMKAWVDAWATGDGGWTSTR